MPDQLSSILESNEVQQLATGFLFTEGPLWHTDGYLYFVDIRRSLIFRMRPGSEPDVLRENSGGSNGLTFDLHGRMVMCEGDARRVTRMEPDGTINVLVEHWQGKRLNRPNDVVGRSDGSLYFTDPGGRLEPSERELDFAGIFRIAPDGGCDPVITDFEYPNGLAFSPDERILYVANTRQKTHITAYDVHQNGSVSNPRIFADMTSDEPDGVPDGMKVDMAGNVYCTGPGGCWVFDSSGKHLGIIRLPEIPANCAWGGPDRRTLFFTARTSVYSMRMRNAGTPVPRSR
jgi:gluconolactonase